MSSPDDISLEDIKRNKNKFVKRNPNENDVQQKKLDDITDDYLDKKIKWLKSLASNTSS